MSEWDSRVPETPEDVVRLLERRIEVHAAWRDKLMAGDPATLKSSEYGSGTIDSHETYIRQYEGAIRVVRGMS